MHEIDELFKRSTRLKDVSNSSENRYYFLYNYDATVEESPENHFPGTPVGVAFLPGWTWHINEMGKFSPSVHCELALIIMPARQNLRPNYFQGHVSNEYDCMTPFPANKQQLFTVPREKQGVYGFVYKISHEDDEKIHRVSSKSKIKMMQCVTILAPHSVYHNVMINVSTYLDPRHTSDALRTTGLMEGSLKGPDQTMKCMWAKAFATMRNYGVPFWYIQSIRNKIMGFLTDPEPISIAPADLLIDTAAAAEEAERASRLERYLLEEVIPEEEDYVVDTPTRCRNCMCSLQQLMIVPPQSRANF